MNAAKGDWRARLARSRRPLACAVALLATLGMLVPFWPGDGDSRFGLGHFWRVLALNREIAAAPAGSEIPRTRLRLLGRQGKRKVSSLMTAVERIQAATAAAGVPPETVRVQARGFSRNEVWILAYDLYPVRVIGRFSDVDGRYDDPIRPDADWLLSHQRNNVRLARLP